MKHYAIIRIQKVHRATLQKATNHNQRLVKEEGNNSIDEKLTKNNQVVFEKHKGMNIDEAVLHDITTRTDRKIRKDAVLAHEIMCSASPTYFYPDMAKLNQEVDFNDREAVSWIGTGKDKRHELGDLDMSRVEKWRDVQLELLKKQYGENLIRVDMHMDEKTPHFHAIVVPIQEKERKHRMSKQMSDAGVEPTYYKTNVLDDNGLSHRFKGDWAYTKIQDNLGKAPELEALGIYRGIKGSRASHQNLKDYGKALAEGQKKIEPINEKLKRPEIITEKRLGIEVVNKEATQKLLESQAMEIKRLRRDYNKMAEQVNIEIGAKNMAKISMKQREKSYEEIYDKQASIEHRSAQVTRREDNLAHKETLFKRKEHKAEAVAEILSTLQRFAKEKKDIEITDDEMKAAVKVGIKNNRRDRGLEKDTTAEIGD